MAKSKALSAPKARAALAAVRDRPRFGEGGDEPYAALKALQALDTGDIDTAMFCAYEIGRMQGSAEAAHKAEQREQALHVRWAKLWNREYDKVKAMRGQATGRCSVGHQASRRGDVQPPAKANPRCQAV